MYQCSAKANLRADSWSVLQPYLPVVCQLTHVGSDIFNLKAAENPVFLYIIRSAVFLVH